MTTPLTLTPEQMRVLTAALALVAGIGWTLTACIHTALNQEDS